MENPGHLCKRSRVHRKDTRKEFRHSIVSKPDGPDESQKFAGFFLSEPDNVIISQFNDGQKHASGSQFPLKLIAK